MKQALMLAAAFVAGILVVGNSFAFRGNEEVNAAVEANDYNAFVEVAPEKLLKKVDSEEAFTEFAEKHTVMQTLHEEMQNEIEAAVAANDFAAFQAAHEAHRTAMDEMRPEDAPEKGKRGEPADEQVAAMETRQQEHFSELVDYYNENGELPEMGMMMGKRGHGHGMRGAGGCDKGDTPATE